MERFWLVWCPQGYVPIKRHDLKSAATKESKRLAESNPGKEYFVLEAIERSKKIEPVETISLLQPVECPF